MNSIPCIIDKDGTKVGTVNMAFKPSIGDSIELNSNGKTYKITNVKIHFDDSFELLRIYLTVE